MDSGATIMPNFNNMIEPQPIALSRSVSTGTNFLTQNRALAPITAHYSLNATISQAFFRLCQSDGHNEGREEGHSKDYDGDKKSNQNSTRKKRNASYSTALAVGMQYCRVALWDIPHHGYYHAPKYRDLKVESAKIAVKVSDLLVLEILPKIQIYLHHHQSTGNTTRGSIMSEGDFREKVEEARLLREVAHENLKLILKEKNNSTFSANQNSLLSKWKSVPQIINQDMPYQQLNQHQLKTEVIDQDMDTSPWWMQDHVCGLLDCIDMENQSNRRKSTDSTITSGSFLTCPPGGLGSVVEEDTPYEEQQRNELDSNKEREEATTMTALSDRFRARFDADFSPTKMERSTSAPAKLIKDKDDQDNCADINSNQLMTVASPTIATIAAKRSSSNNNNNKHNILDYTQVVEQKEDLTLSLPTATPLNEAEKTQFDSDLDRALYLSGLELQRQASPPQPTYYDDVDSVALAQLQSLQEPQSSQPHPKISNKEKMTPAPSMTEESHCKFQELVKSQKIRVEFINTFQGRIKESTNGCTVIAPLMAIHHLCSQDSLVERNDVLMEMMTEGERADDPYSNSIVHSEDEEKYSSPNYEDQNDDDYGIKKKVITSVIDIQTPLVLPEVRHHLGLQKDALIIPSDVHDYLIEENFLKQNQFVGVYGGNILEDEHLMSFLNEFSDFDTPSSSSSNVGSAKRVAATLYFHEHVICIHRLSVEDKNTSSNTKPDSTTTKQKKKFLQRFRSKNKQLKDLQGEPLKGSKKEKFVFDLIDSLPSAVMLETVDKHNAGNNACWLSQTARIRCNGVEELKACLSWYAQSKFNQDELKYIRSYQFDGVNVDFDPRVFQAFVWAESDDDQQPE